MREIGIYILGFYLYSNAKCDYYNLPPFRGQRMSRFQKPSSVCRNVNCPIFIFHLKYEMNKVERLEYIGTSDVISLKYLFLIIYTIKTT